MVKSYQTRGVPRANARHHGGRTLARDTFAMFVNNTRIMKDTLTFMTRVKYEKLG